MRESTKQDGVANLEMFEKCLEYVHGLEEDVKASPDENNNTVPNDAKPLDDDTGLNEPIETDESVEGEKILEPSAEADSSGDISDMP